MDANSPQIEIETWVIKEGINLIIQKKREHASND